MSSRPSGWWKRKEKNKRPPKLMRKPQVWIAEYPTGQAAPQAEPRKMKSNREALLDDVYRPLTPEEFRLATEHKPGDCGSRRYHAFPDRHIGGLEYSA